MGLVYYLRWEYDRAIECFELSLHIYEEMGDRSGISMVIGNMGIVYHGRGEYDRAIVCFERQLLIGEELGDRGGISVAIGSMGMVYVKRGEHDRAMECYERQLRIDEELGNRSGVARAIGNMGNVYSDRGEYERALASLHRAAEEHRAIGFRFGLTYWLLGIGRVMVAVVQETSEMPEYLLKYIPGATVETWHATSLRYARTCAEECIAISDDMSKPDTQFNGRILLARIEAAEARRDVALQCLTEMLETASDDDQRAELHFWLWKIDESNAINDHHAEALRLSQMLFERTPVPFYSERIEELQAAGAGS
jgi:tetratricopeptide (TPR) repeat protein